MKSPSASRRRSAAGFFVLFASLVLAGMGWAEWTLREHVFNDANAAGAILVAKRVAAVYEPRVWPLMGDSRAGNVLVGDSQVYAGFTNHQADADRFAENVAPIIREIQASGVGSNRGIARALNARGVATARGGEWTAVQIGSILRRLD